MPKRSSGRSAARFFLSLVFLLVGFLILLIIGGIGVFAYFDGPTASVPADGTLFTVGSGESGVGIARRLEQEGLIRSELSFKALLRIRNQQSAIKAGTYRIESGMRSRDILELLVSGKQALIRVTIPEGYTMRQTADALALAGVVDKDAFLTASKDEELLKELGIPASSAEGYLFPDTYFLAHGTDGKDAVRILVDALRSRLAEDIPESSALSPKELHKRIILASIVEREYRRPEEAAKIAGVFWNRLRIGMALQSCATVVYVITEILGKPHPETLLTRDTEIQNPYNTYLYPGLPPGPISNPGITALQAAFRPESSHFLYFRLLDSKTGNHYFSESLDEHIKAGSLAVKRIGGR